MNITNFSKSTNISAKSDIYRGIEQIEDLAEKETFQAIEELMNMGTIKNWPALVRLVIGKMKSEMQAKITRINEARASVNR